MLIECSLLLLFTLVQYILRLLVHTYSIITSVGNDSCYWAETVVVVIQYKKVDEFNTNIV